MRPVWEKDSEPQITAYLLYAQRYNVVPQTASMTGRESSTDMFIMKRATRQGGARLGDIVEVEDIRCPVELVPRFGRKADVHCTPYNSLEFFTEVRLNKYSSKEFCWIMDSVML